MHLERLIIIYLFAEWNTVERNKIVTNDVVILGSVVYK